MTKRTPAVKFTKDKRGMWRWSAIAANGKTVADGAEGYKTKTAAREGAAIASQSLYSDVEVRTELGKLERRQAMAARLLTSQPVETARKKITRRRKK